MADKKQDKDQEKPTVGKPDEMKPEIESESLVDDAAPKPADEIVKEEKAKGMGAGSSTGGAPSSKAAPVKPDVGESAPLASTGPSLFNTVTGSHKHGGSETAVANSAGALGASNSVISFKKAINTGRQLSSLHIPDEEVKPNLPDVYKVGHLIDHEETHYRNNELAAKLDDNIYQHVDDYGTVIETTVVSYIDGMIDTTGRAETGASDVVTGYVKGSVDLGLLATLRPGVNEVSANDFGKPKNPADGKYHGRNEDTHILFEINNAGNMITTESRFNDGNILQGAHFSYYKTGAFADTNTQDKADLA